MGRFVPGARLEGKMERTSKIYGKDSIERPKSLFVRSRQFDVARQKTPWTLGSGSSQAKQR